MIPKRILIGLSSTILIAAIAVFGAKITARSADDNATKATVLMNEYTFQVDGLKAGDPLTLTTGKLYNLTLKNTGTLIHEIWFGKNTKMQEGHIDGYSKGVFDGVDMAVTGEQGAQNQEFEIDSTALYEVALNPGQSVTLVFTLPDSAKGDWEMGCFKPMPMPGAPTADAAATAVATADPNATPVPVVTHYNVGMKLKLIVK